MSENLRIMIVAGEPSGDAHSAALVEALRKSGSQIDFEFFGSTGPLMRAAGVESIVDCDNLAIMGLWEVTRVLPRFWRALKQLKRAAIERKPGAVILVDWPEFNLKLARILHRRGFRIIYYISPQLWAWRSYRAKSIERDVDLLLSILPFEKDWYSARGIRHVHFVGHPLVGVVKARYGRTEFCNVHKLDPAKPIISLLPGSRHKELDRILPPMLHAAALVEETNPHVQFVLVIAPSRTPVEAQQVIDASRRVPKQLTIVTDGTREALAASDAAAVASGTATLEAALLNTPMVIVYKESPINWHTLGRLISTDHFGLVNLVAGEQVVTELMQQKLTGELLATELTELLQQPRNREMRESLAHVAQKLGEKNASAQAAELILQSIKSWKNAE